MFAWEIRSESRFSRAGAILALTLLLAAPCALLAGSGTQQSKKDSKKDTDSTSVLSSMPLPDGQAVELLVSQMLGAWQVGNVEMLHKYYADDVMVVSAAWEPPLMGWDNYAKAYQGQYARTNGGRLDRTNSVIKVVGDNAWVTYQWQFSGQVDGNPTSALGHTTLILQKRAGTWLIVLNHTSAVPTAQPATSLPPAAKPPGAAPQK